METKCSDKISEKKLELVEKKIDIEKNKDIGVKIVEKNLYWINSNEQKIDSGKNIHCGKKYRTAEIIDVGKNI